MKYEMEIEIPKDAKDKRQSLCDEINCAFTISGARVHAGRYRVVIEKLPKEKIAKSCSIHEEMYWCPICEPEKERNCPACGKPKNKEPCDECKLLKALYG